MIPTNRTDQTIGPLLISLTNQIFPPHEIIIVADIDFTDSKTESSYKQYIETLIRGHSYTLITHSTHPDFIPGQGASYVRNYGIQKATSDYILCIDDDNILDATMMDQLRKDYTAIDLPAKQ
ncbi:MAG: glycosyltransferase family 2 protein [Candidatus Peribacteria bacterium]|nr:MAG: glycosyltransferase family 2 protein [Candidatus Peribacteria bacterium]